ncbi:hypothetical protein J6590_091682, partial [Homalodisca vitripennis]
VGAGLASAVPPVTELVIDDGDFAVDSALGLVPPTQDDIFQCHRTQGGLRSGD